MDFIKQLRQFSIRAANIKGTISTAQDTKGALVLPFFQLLGYDPFNKEEFAQGYPAACTERDAGVDYAIIVNNKPVILIECRPCTESLEKAPEQLSVHFAAAFARFGILTNGITYNFYTDLCEPNKIDTGPFLTLDILDVDESILPELKRFAKKTLNVDAAFSAAASLKYISKTKALLHMLHTDPPDSFVKYIMGEIYDGRATQNAIEKFRPIIARGFVQYAKDRQSAAQPGYAKENEAHIEDHSIERFKGTEAYKIVKSVLKDMI